MSEIHTGTCVHIQHVKSGSARRGEGSSINIRILHFHTETLFMGGRGLKCCVLAEEKLDEINAKLEHSLQKF
jgi:hypothetical protein